MKNHSAPDLFALLIGIDHYLPNRLPDGAIYRKLGGCVTDVKQVQAFLNTKLGLSNENIFLLTATNTGAAEPPEPKELWPTYENMVTEFQKVLQITRSGDHIYIHYSGHGGRAATIFPELKGKSGFDEALVPMNIGYSEARYLRDVELAFLLKTMVDKQLVVTIVLDSCHSGGATRGITDVTIRGLSTIDTGSRPRESLVGSHSELVTTWKSLSKSATRNLNSGSGWLIEPSGYVLLAACRASESAYEYSFDEKTRNGVLTYSLLDSYKEIGPGLTYKQIHDRILAKVHSRFESQTPQLEGERDRVVFGSNRIQPRYAVNVMKVDEPNQRVLLNTGQVHPVRKGTQFFIYPHAADDWTQIETRLALIEITDLGTTDSWARIIKKLRPEAIEQGCHAVLHDPVNIHLRRTIRLLLPNGQREAIDQVSTLKRIEIAFTESRSGFVQLASNGEPADFVIAVNDNGEYEVSDPAGQAIPNLRPALQAHDENAPHQLVQRLVHLSKYRNIQELVNHDPMSPLAGKLRVEIVGVQPDYEPGDKAQPRPLNSEGDIPIINVGEWIFLRIRNDISHSFKNDPSRILNVTVLDLAPDWSIKQIFPAGAAYFEPLDPGQEILLPLQAWLPPEYVKGKDAIKVFGTLGTTNFRWLELPPLDQPTIPRSTLRGGPTNPLEELLAAIAVREPKTRNLNPDTYPTKGWTSAQIEVQTTRLMGDPV